MHVKLTHNVMAIQTNKYVRPLRADKGMGSNTAAVADMEIYKYANQRSVPTAKRRGPPQWSNVWRSDAGEYWAEVSV